MKSFWLKAHFKELGIWHIKKIKIGSETKLVEKGIFKKVTEEVNVPVYEEREVWVKTGISETEIDGERLTNDLNNLLESIKNDGYEILSITPVISGAYKYDFKAPTFNADSRPSYGWGYGYSYTEGLNILAKKTDYNPYQNKYQKPQNI